MVAVTVSNCCCSFDASLFNADRMFIGPPAAIYHATSAKPEVLKHWAHGAGKQHEIQAVGIQLESNNLLS